MFSSSNLTQKLTLALDNRKAFLKKCHQENTDCYRLFHGTVEGIPGLTIDRYGKQLLIQSFHHAVDINARQFIAEFYGMETVYYHDRRRHSRSTRQLIHGSETSSVVTELGVKYNCDMNHTGQDPLLFLDFRAARRKIATISNNKTVLNTFSFSCGIGISAAVNGAKHVTNVDFAESALNAGRLSASLNKLNEAQISFIQSDFFLAIRQMAGQSVPGRNKPQHFTRFDKKSYGLVILDPPRWAKSKFGTVDLIRDYPSVLKPCVLCTNPGGQLLCTNNVAAVNIQNWLEIVERTVNKTGRMIKNIDVIRPEEDFPSSDGDHPLKQLLLTLD